MTFSDSPGSWIDAGSAAGGAPLCGEAPAALPAATKSYSDHGRPDLPRVVTTGRKNTKQVPHCAGIDLETGEPVELHVTTRGYAITRHVVPIEPVRDGVALIDALAFSVVPPDELSYAWVLQEMSAFLDIESVEHRKGLFGFRFSARFGDGAGIIAWGGESQRGRVYFSLMGQGCSMVRNWAELACWLERHRATIKRADLAYDDFAGKLVSIAWAIQQYQGGGFNAGGRKPVHACYGDWLEGDASTKGRTLGIGNRASGKYARIYEKGKQLGDPSSPWTRVEVEWRAEDRFIPYDILVRPSHYLAGAYPCLSFLSQEQSVIKTVAKAAQIAFDAAVSNAKQHCGKLINLMMQVMQGDYAVVVDKLIRPGIPARIDPYSYHVKHNPAMLDWELRGGAV